MNDTVSDLTCPHCAVGQLKLRLINYVKMYGETLVTAPNMPAWECDVCHTRQIPPEAIQTIEVLISPAGPPPNRYQPPATLPLPVLKRAPRPESAGATSKPKVRAKLKG